MILRLAALLFWTAALAYLSLAAEIQAPPGAPSWDKLNHAAAYAVLACLLIRVLLPRHAASARLLAGVWLACFAYGLLLEGLQDLMGLGRQWEGGDLLANGLGALVSCVAYYFLAGKLSR